MKNKISYFVRYIERIEWQDLTTWPAALKLAVFFLGGGIFLLLGVGLVLKPKMMMLEQARQQEKVLRIFFEKKYAAYAQDQAKRKSIVQQESAILALLAKIPEKNDVSQLLEDISQLGTRSGVMLQSIRLQPENKVSFYVELPIEMSVRGNYHQLARLLSDLIALPYLITFQNVMLSVATLPETEQSLILSMTMKTYQGRPLERETDVEE